MLMKQKLQRLFLLPFIISLFSLNTQAGLEYPDPPERGNYVVDLAHVLTPGDLEKINVISENLWNEKQIPIVVVTINSLASMNAYQDIESYAFRLFNHWKLGRKDRNYGIILVLSLKDKKARIEFGLDYNHRYDSEAQNIMQNYLVPEFRKGEYSSGLVIGVQVLNNLVRDLPLPKIEQPWWVVPLMIVVGILVISIAVSLFKSGRSGWGWAFIIFLGASLWWALKESSSSAFSDGSGGGGGATGSW